MGHLCQYLIHLALRAQLDDVNLQKKKKKEKGSGVSVASPMLKLAKRMKKIKKSIGVDKTAYLFFLGGGGCCFVYISISP